MLPGWELVKHHVPALTPGQYPWYHICHESARLPRPLSKGISGQCASYDEHDLLLWRRTQPSRHSRDLERPVLGTSKSNAPSHPWGLDGIGL